MAGMAKYNAEINSNVKELYDMVIKFRDELTKLKSGNYSVGLKIDNQKIESSIKKLETMLSDISKGTFDEKSFENLSKEITSITSEAKGLATNIGDSGVEKLLSHIQNIDDLLGSLKKGVSGVSGEFQNVGEGLGNIDKQSLQSIIDLFTKMESHLDSIKSVIADVGDGEEFSPLLTMINNVTSSIKQLNESVGNIGINMNIGVGSDTELESKIAEKQSKALLAYQKLFEEIKSSGAGGSYINNAFFDFDINQFDTIENKINAYINFIKQKRDEAKQLYGGYDVLRTETNGKYWNSASSALSQLTRAKKEISSSSEANPLEGLFGNSAELSNVINQLEKILEELQNISKTVSSIDFSKLSISTSTSGIDDLKNKVKELEEELEKVRSASSGTSGGTKSSSAEAKKAIEEETKAQEKLNQVREKADGDSSKETLSIKSMESEISKLNKTVANFKVKPDGTHSFEGWTNQIAELENAVKQYEQELQKIKANGGVASNEEIENVNKLRESITAMVTKMNSMTAGEKGWTNLGVTNTAEKINKILEQNTKMSAQAKAQIKAYYDELVNGKPSKPLKDILSDVNNIVEKEREAGRAGKSWLDVFKTKVLHSNLAQIASMYFSLYRMIGYVQQGISYVTDFNTALTKMSYTMDVSSNQLDSMGKDILSMSKDLKTSISNMEDIYQIYANMQTSSEEIYTMAKPTAILANLTGEDASTAADQIQAVINQFDLLEEDSMHIADVYDKISSNIKMDYSKGVVGIAEGVETVGNVAKEAGKQKDPYVQKCA
jgi:DNA repair exonuclease SbcCD ATPase subunit